jgi:hypothetical protein
LQVKDRRSRVTLEDHAGRLGRRLARGARSGHLRGIGDSLHTLLPESAMELERRGSRRQEPERFGAQLASPIVSCADFPLPPLDATLAD